MRPLLHAFVQIRQLQQLWRESRDIASSSDVKALTDELIRVLHDHETEVRRKVEAAVAAAPDDSVLLRSETALTSLSDVRAGLEELSEGLRQKDWGDIWEHLEHYLETQFAGAGVRTPDVPDKTF